jgi:hypothetical protein
MPDDQPGPPDDRPGDRPTERLGPPPPPGDPTPTAPVPDPPASPGPPPPPGPTWPQVPPPPAPDPVQPGYGPAQPGQAGYGQPGYGPPPGYGQPGYGPPPGYGYPPGPQTDSSATAALVIAVAGFFICAPVGAIVALVLANSAQKRIEESNGRLTGLEQARAARIIAIVELALTAVLILVGVLIAVASLGARY